MAEKDLEVLSKWLKLAVRVDSIDVFRERMWKGQGRFSVLCSVLCFVQGSVGTEINGFMAEDKKETPNTFNALGYDSVLVFKKAMEAAGSSAAADVQAALADTSVVYEVASGKFSFDETGTPIKSGVLMGYSYNEGDATVTKSSIQALEVE